MTYDTAELDLIATEMLTLPAKSSINKNDNDSKTLAIITYNLYGSCLPTCGAATVRSLIILIS